jgi:glyoxylase-like metal-dependent hydrolase (beta-lactamase superfamily II)
MELAQTRLDELLALERRFVFAVFTEIAELDRFPDFIGKRDVQLELQLFRLSRELSLEFFEHIPPNFERQKISAPGRESGPGASEFSEAILLSPLSQTTSSRVVSLQVERFADVTRLRMTSVASRAVGLDVSAYVIRGVMIDTGFHRARRVLRDALRAARVDAAIVTHWHEDHAGNVALLADQQIPLLLRPDTEATLRARPVIQLYRRLVWGVPTQLPTSFARLDSSELTGVHTPGHSADHQVVWDARTGTLFSGDLWLGVRSRILHASEDPYTILASLQTVLALAPERMFDAHRGDVAKPVDAIRAKIQWLGDTLQLVERRIVAGANDRSIVNDLLGGEEMAAVVSRGNYSRRNFAAAVRRRLTAAAAR